MLSRLLVLILGTLIVPGLSATLKDVAKEAFIPSTPNRTVIFMHKETLPGQDLFIRGGIDAAQRPGCTSDAETDACAINIRTHLLGTIDTYDKYNAWRVGDYHLDWHGAEVNQGDYLGAAADGTPTAWTSNNPLSPAYQELNTFGEHHWMVDMEMDCSETEGGMFEVKAFLTNDAIGWESDITPGTCTGDVGGTGPYTSKNHFAKCGCINVLEFGSPDCIINSFPY